MKLDDADRLNREKTVFNSSEVSVDFCEVQEELSYPLASKPAEAFEALRAEKQIQGWSRKKKEALISGNWENLSYLARRKKK